MCHKHGVMHRDLKPENFLFGNMKETAPLKAIDFGLSVFFKPGIFFFGYHISLFCSSCPHQLVVSFHVHKLSWLFVQVRDLMR